MPIPSVLPRIAVFSAEIKGAASPALKDVVEPA
jgi:hypothetical protein